MNMTKYSRIPKIKTADIKDANDLRQYFNENAQEFKWIEWTHLRPYQDAQYHRTKVGYTVKETGYEILFDGIGEQKINVNYNWLSYEKLYDCLQHGYKNNTLVVNSIFCLIFEDYFYQAPTIDEIENIIASRKNAQFLMLDEIPKYVSLQMLKKAKNFNDLPILKKIEI